MCLSSSTTKKTTTGSSGERMLRRFKMGTFTTKLSFLVRGRAEGARSDRSLRRTYCDDASREPLHVRGEQDT